VEGRARKARALMLLCCGKVLLKTIFTWVGPNNRRRLCSSLLRSEKTEKV